MWILEVLCGGGFLLLSIKSIKEHLAFELLLAEVMTLGHRTKGHIIKAGYIGTGITRYFCEYEFIDYEGKSIRGKTFYSVLQVTFQHEEGDEVDIAYSKNNSDQNAFIPEEKISFYDLRGA